MELKNIKRVPLYTLRNQVKINCAAFHQNHLLLGTCRGCCMLFDVLSNQGPGSFLQFGSG